MKKTLFFLLITLHSFNAFAQSETPTCFESYYQKAVQTMGQAKVLRSYKNTVEITGNIRASEPAIAELKKFCQDDLLNTSASNKNRSVFLICADPVVYTNTIDETIITEKRQFHRITVSLLQVDTAELCQDVSACYEDLKISSLTKTNVGKNKINKMKKLIYSDDGKAGGRLGCRNI